MKSKLNVLTKLRDSRTSRIVCAFLVVNLLVEIVSPTMALALTAGPASPEFSSFEPVATTDMVNDFSGDFTYNLPVLNVPGPDGGGYSMSLAYHSGVSSEEEASWVGLGWTLNPGAINRNKRGYADEFNGVDVRHYNKVKPSRTQTARFDLNIELNSSDLDAEKKNGDGFLQSLGKIKGKLGLTGFGMDEDNKDSKDPADISISLSHTVRYNNYTGFSIANGFGGGMYGLANVDMNRSGGHNTFGFSVNPTMIVRAISKKAAVSTATAATAATPETSKPNKKIMIFKNTELNHPVKKSSLIAGRYSFHSYEAPALPYSVSPNRTGAWNFSSSVQLNPAGPFGFQVGIAGSANVSLTEGEEIDQAYGYLNSEQANVGGAKHEVYDFQIEKESTFDKHDKNLGIPFNNADLFAASGNGVVGGFRLIHDQLGSYYPKTLNGSEPYSEGKIRQRSTEWGIGSTWSVGTDFGTGKHKTEVFGKWPGKMPSDMTDLVFANNARTGGNGKPRMRFSGDLGGEVNYSDNYDDLLYAKIKNNKHLDLHAGFVLPLDQNKMNNSSSVAYTQITHTSNPSINGIYITNKDGGKSSYDKPVYTTREADLTISLPTFQDGSALVTGPLNYNYPLKNSTVVGQKVDSRYASQYLLTSNTTFNYIDVDFANNPGPSDEDFGGWTKFGYRQAFGADLDNWYRYRTPYAGLNYNPGRMVDPTDGTGSMSSGDKEVYYLKTIETKSHIAFFVTNVVTASTFTTHFPQADFAYLYTGGSPNAVATANLMGSGTIRYDGVDAAPIVSDMDQAADNLSAKGNHHLERLERIVLFAKSDMSKPLTTTFFDYDYSLCQGIPNSTAPANAPSKDRGKLTLKKVWTESGGTLRSQIAPYEFEYEYFHQYPQSVTDKYSWASAINTNYTSNDPNQNPMYAPSQLDAWGYYQANGVKRFENRQPWVSQRGPSPGFDPAAWQLKRIKLPSGGEIHVQYEQKDYLSVQDQRPTAMVSLLSDENKDEYYSDESVFCINTEDLDIAATNTAAIAAYAGILTNYFKSQSNKLYFKVLYAYTGDDVPQLNTENRRYEYISGYTVVHNVTISGGKILLHLGDVRGECNVLGEGKKDETLPRYVCYQELLSNSGTNLGLNAQEYKDYNYWPPLMGSGSPSNSDIINNAGDKLVFHTVLMFTDWVTLKVKNVPKKKACKKINFDLSYFKLPVYNAKKGGGIRVKRLLTYDPGISGETGDAMLYGSEYIYTNTDGTSSGVATNEPASIREENALVSLMERKKQKWIDKTMNGKDTKHYEGPIGESVMPGAEVAHSRVIIKNIHSAKSSPGFVINNYHTAKEYPMSADFSSISKENDTYKKFNLFIPLGPLKLDIRRAWVTQGYLFKLNDMHGKIAGKATYAGNYNPTDFSESSFSSRTTYAYSAPGEKITSLTFDPVAKQFKWGPLSPGMEEDYTMYTSSVRDKTCDFSVEADFNITYTGGVFAVPSMGMNASFSYAEGVLSQHVTSKVVRQVSYLLSTTNVTDGVAQTTKNLAFDRYTGDPVLTSTYDGYGGPNIPIYTQAGGAVVHDGTYYALNLPASWMYPMLGPKSETATANTNQLSLMAGNVVTYGTNGLYTALGNTATTAWSPTFSNVVNASAVTYTNNWFGAAAAAEYTVLGTTVGTSTVTIGSIANTFFYPERSFSYRDEATNANAGGKIYKDGVISNPFVFFDWAAYTPGITVPTQWYSDSRVTKYSPNGYPVEEQDVLAIKSSAHFGYNNTLPVYVAKNAGYDDVKFVDFEYVSQTPMVQTSAATAHTGRASCLWSANQGYVVASNYPVQTQRGLSVKVWLKSVLSTNINDVNYGLKNPNPQFKVSLGPKDFALKSLAQTGEWTLYSADITNFQGLTSGNYPVKFKYNQTPNELVYIDDVRLQPLDASMNCSVYYADNKLAAQFDDQHFAVLYEYNGKGQLVRKSIETERGKKTLQEQQYNTPLQNKMN